MSDVSPASEQVPSAWGFVGSPRGRLSSRGKTTLFNGEPKSMRRVLLALDFLAQLGGKMGVEALEFSADLLCFLAVAPGEIGQGEVEIGL